MNKTALITGASSGLGIEFAILFAADGYNLVLTARNEVKLKELQHTLNSKYNTNITVFASDLSVENAANNLFNFTQEHNIQIDVLVNNAGFGDLGDFALADMARLNKMINLNITALVTLTHLYVNEMRKNGNGGRILNIGSIASFMPGPYMSVYYATKAFVLNFTQGVAQELLNDNISLTVLCPGPTGTHFFENAHADKKSFFKSKNLAKPEKVAKCGYKALMKGKMIAIPGIRIKIFAFLPRIMPRAIVTKIVKIIHTT